jgi:DNA-binding NtrC family response regulator
MDLFYRLAVTVLHLPPLVDHGEDIPLLVDHFIDLTGRAHGLPPKRARPALLDRLMAHSWPGNVRELRNVVEGLVCMAEGDWLEERDLPPGFGQAPPTVVRPLPMAEAREEERGRALADREREGMIEAIALEAGNLTKAASRLGIAKSTLYEKMKRHGIDRMTAFKAFRDQ